MGIKAKILKELQKKPRRLKELKAKLGNDKKVARAVDELVERNKVVCRKGVYAVPDPKTGNAVECTLCLLYTSPSPRDTERSRMPSSA